MNQKWIGMGLALLLVTLSQPSALAGNVLERIKQTGTIRAGTRKDAIPFGFVDDKGKWVGYSLDMLELIRRNAQQQLGKPIKLQLVAVTAQNRFAKLKNNEIDIECSSTTFTWKRTQQVDFSVSYFASGTQLLVKKGSGLSSLDSLEGRKIGVIPGTTNEKAIKSQQPAAILVSVKNRSEGLQQLQQGKIVGFADDGIVLAGLKKKLPQKNNYTIVPDFPYSYESYACILPHDQSAWRNLINYSLVKFMEGIVSDQQSAVNIYERWFGEEGVTPYSRETINDYFQGIINAYEWIPLIGQ